jgi:stage II sporulation protein D
VNKLRLEKYLLGVVPREMSPSWSVQALKAQAVAARSYAYYLVLHSRDKPYDVAATTASQVYGGAEAGNPTTDKAVIQTRGEVLVYKGKPILSYFHSHSGGVLEDAGKVWTTSLPYYKVIPDPVSMDYKDLSWNTAISGSDLARSLRRNGFEPTSILNVSPAERSSSGRISRVRISTDQEDFEISSNSLRIWLGAGKIKSTLCSIEKRGGEYIFSGHGFGHGVGMSQWGAQGMAENGEGYQRILEHYYPQTELRKLW